MSTKILLRRVLRLTSTLIILAVGHTFVIPISCSSARRDVLQTATKRCCIESSEISRRTALNRIGLSNAWLITAAITTTTSVLIPTRDANAAENEQDSSGALSEKTEAITTSTTTTSPARPVASPAESIRRAASSIPGLGPTDILFPGFMLGKWYLTRDIVTSNDPRLEGMLLPFTLKYEIRFIPSLENDYVVADRGYNQASLERAFAKALRSSNNDPIQSLEWSETNPNVLVLTMVDGTKTEIKVTKRATEKSPDGLGISTFEFQRYTVENARGIPKISARRVVTKWKVWDQATADGIELVYDMGLTSGDPMLLSSSDDVVPRLISKARFHLDRINESTDEGAAVSGAAAA